MVFHSLSKRSSVPGLRSGFVAGDPRPHRRFLLYRTYHGSAMPLPTQLASTRPGRMMSTRVRNRRLYQEKFERVLPILARCFDIQRPDGAFYLWPDVRGDDERFVRDLYASHASPCCRAAYLAREGADGNPGAGRVRISLVPPVGQCVEAAERVREFIQRNPS